MASTRKRRKAIEQIVEREWSDYAIDDTKQGHVRVTLRAGDKTRFVITGSTSGDRHGLLNFRQDLRRNLEILKSEARA